MWIANPSWAPDSEHIILLSSRITRDSSGIYLSLAIMGITSLILHQTHRKPAFLPTWSPKRNQIGYIDNIAITQPPPPNPLQIYMMDLTKESVTALTSGGDEESIPLAWHPRWAQNPICLCNILSVDQEILGSDIFVMDNNGENIINLTQTPEIFEMYAVGPPTENKLCLTDW